jgi:hypothetical protein
MIREFTAPLIIGQARYSAIDLGIISRFGRWVHDRPGFPVLTLYDPAIGKSDEGKLVERGYDIWRAYYGRGEVDPNRPLDWAISNDQKLCFGPTTDAAYILSGEYRASLQTLTVDGDVPEMPEEFHNAIVYEAWRLMCVSDGDAVTIPATISDYRIVRSNLYRDFLPEITIGGSEFA